MSTSRTPDPYTVVLNAMQDMVSIEELESNPPPGVKGLFVKRYERRDDGVTEADANVILYAPVEHIVIDIQAGGTVKIAAGQGERR